jgi:hypothetical protein
LRDMTREEEHAFQERVAATAIANQAILRCMILGMPLTVDNVTMCVSDFVDPEQQKFRNLIEQIEQAIDVTVNMSPYSGKVTHGNA